MHHALSGFEEARACLASKNLLDGEFEKSVDVAGGQSNLVHEALARFQHGFGPRGVEGVTALQDRPLEKAVEPGAKPGGYSR